MHPAPFAAFCLLALTLLPGRLALGQEAEWPQWLGPHRNGDSAERGLLQDWPAGGPKRLWLARDAGLGYSGPSLADGRLYIMGAEDGKTFLTARDPATGKRLWTCPMGATFSHNWGDGPSGTPTYNDGRVYALSCQGDLVCADASTGDVVWRTTMEALGGERPQWGFCESPLIDGAMLIITPGGAQGTFAALDKETGAVVWRSTGIKDKAHYSSVVIGHPHGKKQYIQLLEKRVVGISPEDGALLWESPFAGRVAVIPTPYVRDNYVYVTAGYGIGCKLVQISEDNQATVVYDNRIMKNQHGGIAVLGKLLYGHSDDAGWICQDLMSGKRVWREREALGKGSVAYADGRLYCLAMDTGEVALVDPNKKGWDEHGRFTLDPQTTRRKDLGRIWTHPVVVDGRMYLRDQELLYAYDVRAQ